MTTPINTSGTGTPNSMSDTQSETTAVTSAPVSPTESFTDNDININVTLPGWPTVATIMAADDDFQAFPSFLDLNIKSLLYYQAELVSLRKQLHTAEWEDSRRKGLPFPSPSTFSNDVECLLLRPDSEQWKYIDKIREVLTKYNHALLQFSQVSDLQKADSLNVECLRQRLKTVKSVCGTGLSGAGSYTWGTIWEKNKNQPALTQLFLGLFTDHSSSPESQPEDSKPQEFFKEQLIVPRRGGKTDALTLWVAKKFVPFYHALRHAHLSLRKLNLRRRKSRGSDTESADGKKIRTKSSSQMSLSASIRSSTWTIVSVVKSCASLSWSVISSRGSTSSGKEEHRPLTHYSRGWMTCVASIITTVVASLLPIVAITVLAKIHSMGETLGIIALFTAVFAIGLSLLVGGSSRVEIFTATAAFSAVMVVFVQNQTSMPSLGS